MLQVCNFTTNRICLPVFFKVLEHRQRIKLLQTTSSLHNKPSVQLSSLEAVIQMNVFNECLYSFAELFLRTPMNRRNHIRPIFFSNSFHLYLSGTDDFFSVQSRTLTFQKKICVICLIEDPLEVMKNAFCSQDIQVFVTTFWSCRENGLTRKISLT